MTGSRPNFSAGNLPSETSPRTRETVTSSRAVAQRRTKREGLSSALTPPKPRLDTTAA